MAPAGNSHAPHPLLETWTTKQTQGFSEVTQAGANSCSMEWLMLNLLGNPETSQEWSYGNKAGGRVNPGAVISFLLQTTALQCQSHKTKGGHSIQKKASLGDSRKHIADGRAWTRGQKPAETSNAGHCLQWLSLMRRERDKWRFYNTFIYVLKPPGNSFRISISLLHKCVFLKYLIRENRN